MDAHCPCDEEKRTALNIKFVEGRVPNGQDAREQNIRRQCDEDYALDTAGRFDAP